MPAVKIVHTADVHLDLCYAGLGLPASYGTRRRQRLREAFQRIVVRAGEWPADALLIAGDLFEGDRVTRDTIAFLKAQFASIPHVSVVIAPGSGDPFTATSPYATETWPVNVHIFQRPEWEAAVVCEGALTVHGFAFDGAEISRNPFGELRLPADGSVHVAVAYGTERGHAPEEVPAVAPFEAAAVADEALRYLALGQVHAFTPIEGDFRTKIAYAGSPEGHGFDEFGERHFVEVTVDGDAVRVEPVPSARVHYRTHSIDCGTVESSAEIVQALRGLAEASPTRLIARVALTGNAAVDIGAELESLHDTTAGEFEFLQLIDETLPTEDYDALAREETSLGLFVRGLTEEIADQSDPVRAAMLMRAREVGVAAFRGRRLAVRGMERDGL